MLSQPVALALIAGIIFVRRVISCPKSRDEKVEESGGRHAPKDQRCCSMFSSLVSPLPASCRGPSASNSQTPWKMLVTVVRSQFPIMQRNQTEVSDKCQFCLNRLPQDGLISQLSTANLSLRRSDPENDIFSCQNFPWGRNT